MPTSSTRAFLFRSLSIIGLCLSTYALYVEHIVSRQKANPGLIENGEEVPFVALCDLGSWASCSDVLTSPSSRLFGPPNALLGVLFYIITLLYPSLTFIPKREYLLLAGVSFGCALSVYLATVLYQMGDFCVLCVSNYVINYIFLFLTFREIKSIDRMRTKPKKY